MTSPIDRFLDTQGVVVLDGGLATELEARGNNLDHALWSARLLLGDPQQISAVHLSYLEAGADCITTASYQATFPGFAAVGLSRRRSAALLAKTVTLAEQARERFCGNLPPGRLRPLIAASIGSYGAYLADGSEYRGEYALSAAALHAFHAPRWEVLATTEADLIACETIPSALEGEVLLRLLEQTPDRRAWISFSCRDRQTISDGTPLRACADLLKDSAQIAAVGVNCTAPELIEPLIAALAESLDGKPIIVYPNSGECYDPRRKAWSRERRTLDLARAAVRWRRAGAALIGGCCRIGPTDIRSIRQALVPSA